MRPCIFYLICQKFYWLLLCNAEYSNLKKKKLNKEFHRANNVARTISRIRTWDLKYFDEQIMLNFNLCFAIIQYIAATHIMKVYLLQSGSS